MLSKVNASNALVSVLLTYLNVGRFTSFGKFIQIEVQSNPISVASVSMPTHFLDLTANLSLDDRDVTCASSSYTNNRNIEITLHQIERIYTVVLLMHKYVNVDLEVFVGSRNSETRTLCNRIQNNTGLQRMVFVNCNRELNGELITVKDGRKGNEFFVICEVRVYGAPEATYAPVKVAATDLVGVYIGCGAVALLILATVVVFIIFRKCGNNARRHSEAISLNTLSMMNSHEPRFQGNRRQAERAPIPSPRPRTTVYRSQPNLYDRPTSVKEAHTIYETIPDEEPPYLILLGEKELYDEASSYKKENL